ncbi:MAG: NAD+ synthase [Bacteroidia bacterium]|nr:NAD+ synthase [Bacteroidia bacterium]MBP7260923.1 NAD+ synthase [Bacteroidia bacterium]MBP9180319.1 NAD+ synthase [Bacteroidia bacterium]MBP9724732.1 NAD+ synthase [Bacteroidia bacterium]
MKIALAQLNYHVGNFEQNTSKIIRSIERAKNDEADLIVFAELSICGYPPRDFLEFNDFIRLCNEAVENIAQHCTGIAAIVGAPAINPQVEGKDLFNAAWFLSDGKVSAIRNKTLLPTYDVFDEYRYFEPNRSFDVITCAGKKIALTICEDLWNINHNPLYITTPMDELIKHQPDVIINIAASPFSHTQLASRTQVLRNNVEKYKLPLLYVNHVGAQTELIFDGGSLAMNAQGEIVEQLKSFEEDYSLVTLEEINTSKGTHTTTPQKMEQIEHALVLGIRDYFKKLGFTKAILGLSGGIDSALVVYLAARALGEENVKAVLMPSQFSSDHSISDSLELCKNLRVTHELIPIERAFNTFRELLQPAFGNLPFDLTEENMQARCRGLILMGLSNKFGYILLNTSNKSELAVGYGTLYGDMCGGLSVIGDLYKTEIFELCRYINRDNEIIPENIITKPPSAELRPNQKDSDSLPDYEQLDPILFEYIEKRKSPGEIIRMGYNESIVKRILRLVNMNEYKRHQTPPILRISPKAFGMGRRMPIVAKYLTD